MNIKSTFYWIALPLVFIPMTVMSEGIEGTGIPRLYIPERSYEFQAVVSGTEVSHTYSVQNTGTATLEIKRVATG